MEDCMDNSGFFKKYYQDIFEKCSSISGEDIELINNKILEANNCDGTIFVAGNGGSASIASHTSIDFTKAAGLRSVTFNESSLITCFSNDYGYDKWVEKAIEFYADKNDLIILISSSGESMNIINAAKFAKKMDISLVTLSGFSESNSLRGLGDINLWVDSTKYNIVETVHQVWLLSIMDYYIENK